MLDNVITPTPAPASFDSLSDVEFSVSARLVGLPIQARLNAESEFEGKTRKSPPGSGEPHRPYFTHLEAVAEALSRHGFGPEVVAAGYLHDHLEDLPSRWTKERIAEEFTPRTAELVNWVTQKDKSLSWEERNARYAERLAQAPDEALAISAADKLSNMRDTSYWMERGYRVEEFLKRGWKQNSEKMHELRALFIGRIPEGLMAEFTEALRRFDELGSASAALTQ